MLWKVTFDSKIKGVGLEDCDANVLMFNTRENYMLVEEGGLPAVFERLQKYCKTQIRFNTRVLSIDYRANTSAFTQLTAFTQPKSSFRVCP